MTASQIIAESEVCRQAARNIYPQDPDELFNVVWLKIREREIQDPAFSPDDPKRYFLRAMRNQVVDWQREPRILSMDSGINSEWDGEDRDEFNRLNRLRLQTTVAVNDSADYPGRAFIDEWLNTPTDDEDLLFLKNILTLALNCNNNKAVITMIGISDRQYYTYKKLAKKRLYADYYATNNCDDPGSDLV